ncbi:proteasome-activating nucleotidase [Candidatus Woesearchaeota archaeon CG10_big_fil_rev_8_21_14_0_10_44_13]|nr:MAG: proteasome-activating nucleotidase [Candidatus Woesearchaeota archaeon CG10_big_fil_rev_8_21_14_0_10_44_13]
MEVKDKEVLDKVISSYSIDISGLEEENRVLKQTLQGLKEELNRFQKTPLLVAEVRDVHGENMVVRLPNGNEFFVESSIGCKDITPGDSVLVEQKNLTIVRKIDTRKRFNVENFLIIEKPSIKWENVGGLKKQEEEIKEVIELPLKNPALFKKIGIHPPKGILLYGPPGTGKTLLAKAVAASTNSTFIEIVGSELVQKFIGEGAKLVKEVFQLAREKAPSIVFIDEMDAIAAQRVDIGTSGEREVQRTFMQLLAEIDGFKSLGNVKIIGCTNRRDILDPAVTRPGRLDRLIYVPLPEKEGIEQIFKIHTKDMKMGRSIKLGAIFKLMEGFSGAEIKAVATEAGYFAIRAKRTGITEKDLIEAIKKVKEHESEEGKDYLGMFG